MEVGVIVGAVIFFGVIVPTLFPKTYKKINEAVSKWADKNDPPKS